MPEYSNRLVDIRNAGLVLSGTSYFSFSALKLISNTPVPPSPRGKNDDVQSWDVQSWLPPGSEPVRRCCDAEHET